MSKIVRSGGRKLQLNFDIYNVMNGSYALWTNKQLQRKRGDVAAADVDLRRAAGEVRRAVRFLI